MKNKEKFLGLLKSMNQRESKKFFNIKLAKHDMEWFSDEHEKELRNLYEGIKITKVTHRSSNLNLISIHWGYKKPQSSKTKYLRLFKYEEACKVLDFILKNDSSDYSYITVGGLAMQVKESNWITVENFIKSINSPYEITENHPHIVEKEIMKKYL